MLKLLKSRTTEVPVLVESTVNVTGYQAVINIDQIGQKTVSLSSARPTVTFTAAEVGKIYEDGEYGVITIYDSDNEVHIKQLMFVAPVDKIGETYGFDKIHLVIVGAFDKNSEGTGGSSVKHREFLSVDYVDDTKYGINDVQQKINEVLGKLKGV